MGDSESMLELSRRQITLSVCFSTNITTLPAKAMWHQGKRASPSLLRVEGSGTFQEIHSPFSELCSCYQGTVEEECGEAECDDCMRSKR